MESKRLHERQNYRVPATIEFSDGMSYDAEVQNISSEGILLAVDNLENLKDDEFVLRFLLSGKSRALKVNAEVAWSMVSESGKLLIGTKLINNKHQNDLNEYLEILPELEENRLI